MSVLFPQNITAVEYTFVQVGMTITKTAGTPYIIQADIQPEAIDYEASEQGRKDTGLVKVYSNTKLTIAKEGQTLTGTVLTWQDQKWEIIEEMPYQANSMFSFIDHFKYRAQLLNEGELS